MEDYYLYRKAICHLLLQVGLEVKRRKEPTRRRVGSFRKISL
nr:MAG TPA: hypothetical protein [Caudoviricetes sp.]